MFPQVSSLVKFSTPVLVSIAGTLFVIQGKRSLDRRFLKTLR